MDASADLSRQIKILRERDKDARANAARAVFMMAYQGIVDKAALHPLIGQLDDESPKVREWCAYAIGEMAYQYITDKSALPPLIKLLKDDTVIVRQRAAYAIGVMAYQGVISNDALSPLNDLLDDEDEKVRSTVDYALQVMASKGFALEDHSNYPEIFDDSPEMERMKLAQSIGQMAQESLESDVDSPRRRIRLSASVEDNEAKARTVFFIGYMASKGIASEDAFPLLFRRLVDKSMHVRVMAAWVIGQMAELGISSKDALPLLIKLRADCGLNDKMIVALAIDLIREDV